MFTSLQHMGLSAAAGKTLAGLLRAMPALNSLYVSQNSLRDAGVEALAADLKRCV
jgi:hypothetical protein